MITKLVKSGVKPRQIVMGISLYGRSFELEDADCTEPGCPARGNGRSDDCLRKPGLLSRSEIIQILNKTEGVANIKPKAAIKEILNMTSDASKLDEEAAVKYLVWDNEWWVNNHLLWQLLSLNLPGYHTMTNIPWRSRSASRTIAAYMGQHFGRLTLMPPKLILRLRI